MTVAFVVQGTILIEEAPVGQVVEGEPLAFFVGKFLAFVETTLGVGRLLLSEDVAVATPGDVTDGFLDRAAFLTARAPLVGLLLAVSLHQVAQIGVGVMGEPQAVGVFLAADAAIQELGVVFGRHDCAQVAKLSVADQVQRGAVLYSGHARRTVLSRRRSSAGPVEHFADGPAQPEPLGGGPRGEGEVGAVVVAAASDEATVVAVGGFHVHRLTFVPHSGKSTFWS